MIGALLFSSLGATNVIGAENSCQQNIFISEIGWAGSSKSAVDEWLELANAGETESDLSGWMIEGAGTSGSTLTLPGGAIIPSRSTYLIANYNAESDKSVLAAPPNYVNTAISLSNSALRLLLKDKNGCQIDAAGDGGAPFFGGTGTAGMISMVRLQPLTDGNLSTSWTATENSSGFDNGFLDKGTPGGIEWVALLASTVGEETGVEGGEVAGQESVTENLNTVDGTSIEGEETSAEEAIMPSPLPETVEGERESVETPTTEITTGEIFSETIEEVPTTTEETITPSPPLEWSDELKTEEEGETVETIAETTEEQTPEMEIVEIKIKETPSPIVTVYPRGVLLINEFVSDPVKGEKEWVEVINPNNATVSLAAWKISESSGRTIQLPNLQLGYGQIATADFSSGALNNDGDTIRIIAPDGTVVDELVYGTASLPAAADPYSVARGTEENFVITESPTKGKMNIITKTITVMETAVCENSNEENEEAETTVTVMEDETSTRETVVVDTVPPTICLSELYPNTGGADATDEFIELENYGSETVDLFGLSFQDATGNEWSFADHRELAAGKFLAISRTEYQFALNNSGNETVQLHSVDGILLDQTQYENAPKNFTFARDNELWRWTSIITRDEPNSFPTTVEPEDSGVVRQASADFAVQRTDASESVVRVNIAEARALARDTEVSLEGIVSVVPNIFGRQIFYLTDNATGIQIYKSDGNFPELVVGDLVEINGTISSNRGEPRIKISQEDEIVVIEGGLALEIAESETIGEAEAGQLVRLTGMVTEKSRDKFTLETDGGLSEARIKENTEIDLSKLKPGASVVVTGIVGQSEEKYFLLPRSPNDLINETPKETAAPIVSIEPTGKQVAAKANQKNAIIISIAVIVGLIVYALNKRRGNKIKSYEKSSKLSFAPTG